MKAIFFLAISAIITGCASSPVNNENLNDSDGFMNIQKNGNFSDRGAIALIDDDYRFTIILVKDLEWALESMRIADYGLPHISQFTRNEKVSPYLTFGTFGKETVDLTYSVKLQKPDGKYAVEEYHDLTITRSTLFASMTYPAQEFATIRFDETDALGIYQFHIVIKDGGTVINTCIMQFELIDEKLAGN